MMRFILLRMNEQRMNVMMELMLLRMNEHCCKIEYADDTQRCN